MVAGSIKKPDRRVERTRVQLFDAFRDVLLQRGYAKITVGDIIEAANVGRSTFYEHFQSKSDLLEQSIRPLFAVMAETAGTSALPPALEPILAHFYERGPLVKVLFTGAPRRILTALLAELIEEQIGGGLCIPPAMAAAQIAHGQFALLESWLFSNDRIAAAQIAQAMSRSSRAAAVAMKR